MALPVPCMVKLSRRRARPRRRRRRKETLPAALLADTSVVVIQSIALSQRTLTSGGPLVTTRYRR